MNGNRTLVHGARACQNDRHKEIGDMAGNQRRPSRRQVSERRYALPDDKRKRVGTLRENRAELRDIFFGFLFMFFVFILFAIAGSMDWETEQAYQRAWAEANGIEMEAADEAD